MVQLDEDRISRWKCLVCGSKQKKIIDAITKSGKKAGFSLHCCNCGHIDQFALTTTGIDLFCAGNSDNIAGKEIHCGVLLQDIECCGHKSCTFRPLSPKECKKEDQKCHGDIHDTAKISKELLSKDPIGETPRDLTIDKQYL